MINIPNSVTNVDWRLSDTNEKRSFLNWKKQPEGEKKSGKEGGGRLVGSDIFLLYCPNCPHTLTLFSLPDTVCGGKSITHQGAMGGGGEGVGEGGGVTPRGCGACT